MSKKLIKNMALLVALLALCLTAAFSASAATENGYTYTVTDGKATITAVDSTVTGDVVIPDTLGGYPVTELEESLFADRTDLTGITIPKSVTSIGECAFYGCTGLKSITIPEGVTSISDEAFGYCTGLTKIYWNAKNVSLKGLDDYYSVFTNAGTATDGIKVVFGDTVEIIPDFAFSECDMGSEADNANVNIKSVTIGNSVKSIGKCAFYSCAGLTNVTIPDSVTSIGERAFNNCTGLTNVTIPDSATIGKSAFDGCTGLTSITIPDSVESIGSSAFADTAWLDAQPYGDVYAGKVYYTYKGTMLANTSVVIKDGTKSIADRAFYDRGNLVEITIPDGVTSIGESAFYRCSNLKTVTLPYGVKNIENHTFANSGLSEIIIPDSVQSIGRCAFLSCDNLRYIEIPGSVKTIGDNAFEECYGLRYVSIEEGVEKIGDFAFSRCSVRNIIIPDSVTDLGLAFYACDSLESVTIGNGVDTIKSVYDDMEGIYGTFNCPYLTEIKLGRNIKTIEEDAFTGLRNFPEVYFAGSEEEWQAVSVHNSNDMLLRGNMHYNADISHTHSYNEEIVRQATCTEDGEKLYICDCGKVSHSEVIPASHSYCIDEVVDPTCTEDGYTWYYCTRCDDSYKDDFVPARGYHVPGEWIYETGSCTEGGTRYKECVDCGEIVESEYVAPTEHTVVTDPAVAATCTTSGLTEGSHCSVCGEVLAEQEYIPATGHTEVFTEYVEPTCTEDGKTIGKVCSVCGEVIIPAVTIPARGHHYTEWIVTANPTCTVDGKQIKICACGLYEEQSIPAIGHTDENADGVCDNCSCVTDGTQQGEEEKPNSFFARIREFFAKLIEMLKIFFK